MAGEQIATNSAFAKSASSSIPNNTYTYVQRFGKGNRGYMNATGTSGFFDDTFKMTMYYYHGGWNESNSYVYPDDRTTLTAIACANEHSYFVRWYFLWDSRAYGDGQARFSGAGYVYSAYYINHTSYPAGRHLPMYRLTNFGCNTSNVAATWSSGSLITTAQNICTKYQ